MTTVYKVVRKLNNGTLVSAASHLLPKKYRVVYKPHEITRAPDNTKLFVFRHFVPAWDWLNPHGANYDNLEIWRATCDGFSDKVVTDVAFLVPTPAFTGISRYWKAINHDGDYPTLITAPFGTRMVDWVKLEERVDQDFFVDR